MTAPYVIWKLWTESRSARFGFVAPGGEGMLDVSALRHVEAGLRIRDFSPVRRERLCTLSNELRDVPGRPGGREGAQAVGNGTYEGRSQKEVGEVDVRRRQVGMCAKDRGTEDSPARPQMRTGRGTERRPSLVMDACSTKEGGWSNGEKGKARSEDGLVISSDPISHRTRTKSVPCVSGLLAGSPATALATGATRDGNEQAVQDETD